MLKGNLVEGKPFGRYQLIELLGRGGMGEVWRAHDTAIDRVVALKLLLPRYAQDPDFEKRFRREAHAAARLDDPHVVPIYDVGELDGRYLETTTYANGQPQTQADYAVKTDCLRTGERCMSRFHSPLSGFVPLVFEAGRWTSNLVGNGRCPFGGDLSQVKWTAEYPLPQPPQDPIQSLTGRGHQEQTGSCAVNTDVFIAYKRIGD